MMDWLFDPRMGCVVCAIDQAQASAQLLQQQIALQQRLNPYYDMGHFFRMPDYMLPLDERFADFKRRLADAVERNEGRKG